MPVFTTQPNPDSLKPKRHSELNFDYYSHSSRPSSLAIRGFVEACFEEYPEGAHKNYLLTNLPASDDAFTSAVFEVLLNSLFIRLGCSPEPEPLLGDLGSSRPDFKLTLPGGQRLYVEAVAINGTSTQERSRNQRLNVLYDYIDDNLDSEKFFWGMEIKGESPQSPNGRRIVDRLQAHLDTLSWEELAHLPEGEAMEILRRNEVRIASNGWEFEFWPIPKKESAFKKGGRPLGLFPMVVFMSMTKDQIRTQIRSKRKQHPVLDAPLVLAINALQLDADDEDYLDAIYGTHAVTATQYADGHVETNAHRLLDGAWLDKNGLKHQHMPYFLGFRNLTPSSVASSAVTLYANPYSAIPEESFIPNLSRFLVTEDGAELLLGSSIREIFELPAGWPDPDRHVATMEIQQEMIKAINDAIDD